LTRDTYYSMCSVSSVDQTRRQWDTVKFQDGSRVSRCFHTGRQSTTNTYYSKCSVTAVDQTQSRTDSPAGRGYIIILSHSAGTSESRRDQEEGGELDSHEEVDTFAGPGEIKRREVALDPQVSPEEIKSREVELGSESWTSFASVVSRQRCYGHCLCESAPPSS